MAKKEILQPNIVEPTLFVGVGGIGSRIIKGVADRCLNDNTENLRFVVLDTDVNDLTRLENGSVITAVQTSSTRSIKDYLDFDTDAKKNWFPVNRILDSKTVSEGAGQVRAISRLALNATIKQGTISKLYDAIDDLYLKDGADKSRAIKVVIASTVAGGTGSGIALETAMIIRDYLSKYYPESAAIIRGFFIMPGVMDTVIKTESEKQSLRRNGYATIREINAFMMKGSGFFDSNPELKRYKDLCLTVPSTNGPDQKLDNLPFDFCFLVDRIDEKQRSMQRLPQYENFVAQSIYEQNVGPMRKSASSKEDNIVKEFIIPEKLGRCRFGSAGASVLRYPYEDIRDYIAYNWAEKSIIGNSGSKLSEEERAAMVAQSWLKYDFEYNTELKKFENDNTLGEDDKPELSKIYTSSIETSEDDFSEKMRNRYLTPKFRMLSSESTGGEMGFKIQMEKVAEDFIQEMANEVAKRFERTIQTVDDEGNEASNSDVIFIASNDAEDEGLKSRYDCITMLSSINEDSDALQEIVKGFIRTSFKSDNSIKRRNTPAYVLESYLKTSDKVLHPNAVRYLLYKLQDAMQKTYENTKVDYSAYSDNVAAITQGKDTDGKKNKNQFKVKFNFSSESTLEQMCIAIDDRNRFQETLDTATRSDAAGACNEMLQEYCETVRGYYRKYAKREVCRQALPILAGLISAYTSFYKSFEGKVSSIERKKENIVSKLSFNNGDCVLNLFSSKELLDLLVEKQGSGTDNADDEAELFADIYDSAKHNSVIDEKQKNNPLLREAKKDIFDDVIIGYYRKLVEKNCDAEIDLDVLHGIKYEFEVESLAKMKKVSSESKKQEIVKYSKEKKNIDNYIKKQIERARNLASPAISKVDFEEPRDVQAIAFGVGVKDGNGIYAEDFLEEKNRSDSVSKYELHFFSSNYNIMPTQIAKLAYGKPTSKEEEYSLIRKSSGDYFNAYQLYMEKIGPDTKLNPVITPHIDKRWNSISVMPELDLEFQRDLMRYIHMALIYGFIYKSITRHAVSSYAPDWLTYRFTDTSGNHRELIVSNNTTCDELYEVLDALYFDRATVNEIHRVADGKRTDDENKTTAYEDTYFVRSVEKLDRTELVDCGDEDPKAIAEAKTSLFEIPVLYYNSLPARKKDAAEIAIMAKAILEVMYREIETFCFSGDVNPLFATIASKHFTLLTENYKKFPKLLGQASEDVIVLIKETIIEKLNSLQINVPKEIEEFRF